MKKRIYTAIIIMFLGQVPCFAASATGVAGVGLRQQDEQGNTIAAASAARELRAPSATHLGQNIELQTGVVETVTTPQGKKTIKNIEVYGTNSISAEQVMQKISTRKGDEYSRDLVQSDLQSIYSLGYFSDKIRAVPVDNPDGTINLKIMLEENNPVKDFTVEGNTVVSTGELMDILLPMRGMPQNVSNINDAIAAIQNCYSEKGYILARVDYVNDDPDGVLNVNIKEGTINKIHIAGNEKTKSFVIERNILTEPGTIYNENVLKEDLVRLYATQAFKNVTREIEPTSTPDNYDITIKIEEQRTAAISIGGGLDSVTGLFGSAGISDNNFRGLNQRLSLNGTVGTGMMMNDSSVLSRMNMQAELSFFEPYFYNADTSLMSRLFYRDFGSWQVPQAIERRIGTEVTVAHRMKTNQNMTGTFTVGAENIMMKEGDANRVASLFSAAERAQQLQGGLFMSVGPGLKYDTRDNMMVPRKGTLADLRFTEAVGLNHFDRTHGKLTGMIKQYMPVGKKSSLSFTAKAGGRIHGDNMPDVMAYRLGGPYTVRGFKMSGVGTGDAFVMGSAELAVPLPFVDRKYKFLENVRLTAWVDSGKMFNPTVADRAYDRPGYAITYGVGMKLFVPGMGPLSLDYGIPLTPPGSSGNKNGYFSFGAGDMMMY